MEAALRPNKVVKPKWLRVKLPVGKKYAELRELVNKYGLHTICQSGNGLCNNVYCRIGSLEIKGQA